MAALSCRPANPAWIRACLPPSPKGYVCEGESCHEAAVLLFTRQWAGAEGLGHTHSRCCVPEQVSREAGCALGGARGWWRLTQHTRGVNEKMSQAHARVWEGGGL